LVGPADQELMIYKYYFICTLLSVSLITSCAKKEEIDLSSTASIPFTGSFWTSNCHSTGRAKIIAFTDSGYTEIVYTFTDGTCTTEVDALAITGTYITTYDSNTLPGQIWIKGDIDKTKQTYSLTPDTVAAANTMNTASRCGFTNWSAGVTKDVTGLNCGDGVMTAGVTEYNMFSYSLGIGFFANSPGDLEFGYITGGADGTTPANRPTAWDGNFIFRKY